MISAIAAVDENWGIGFNGELLEKIPEDLKHFKKLTTDNIVVMGRKTWDSLPNQPLPDRLNIVLSRYYLTPACEHTLCMTLESLKYVLDNKNRFSEDIFIIGGGQIYKELLPFCDRVYITKIFKSHNNVDTYFPTLEQKEWEITHQSEILTFNDLQYQFLTYDRIN